MSLGEAASTDRADSSASVGLVRAPRLPRRPSAGARVGVGSSGSAMGSDLIDLLGPTRDSSPSMGETTSGGRVPWPLHPSVASHDRAGSERVEPAAFEAVEARLEPLGVASLRRQDERAREVVLGAHLAGQLAVLGLARAARGHVEREKARVGDDRDGHVAVVGDAHLPRTARGRRLDRERDVRRGRRVVGLRRRARRRPRRRQPSRPRARPRDGASRPPARLRPSRRSRRPERPPAISAAAMIAWTRPRDSRGATCVSPAAPRAAPCRGWRSRIAS